MLYVVAWPLLGEADDMALRRLRAQYHPREADLIGPHFTEQEFVEMAWRFKKLVSKLPSSNTVH